MPRVCYHTDESYAERVDGVVVYHIAKVTENQRGYMQMVCTDPRESVSLDVVRDKCDKLNAHLGLSKDDVLDIVMSSMRLSF
jgi:hypothetical protein